ncbi:MAG: bifunctional homocysteine S-methyltransferase/methylenetetrahydrofolate reductase [Chthoniobacteraceae bacterium]|nr:bifunctional homocysteine S-methyltransferase/methylenetetrahydrofolate reductase [Chthoniobacteraceae bacterium]
MDLLDELQNRVLPADGAMGTLLMERGIPLEHCFEELSLSDPSLVKGIHGEYIAAGARLIETNSFGANSVRLAKHRLEHRVVEINGAAARLARAAAHGKGVYVAGSIGPLGISAEQAGERGIDRAAVFAEQMGALLDGGIDVIQLETFLNLNEILLALEVKHSLSSCPAICSLSCNEEGRLPGGMPLADAFLKLRAAKADVVGVNCVNGPQAMLRLFERLPVEGLVSASPNAGYPQYHEGRFLYSTTPDYFAQAASRLAQSGVRLVGGCCGTGPRHIAAMASAFKKPSPVAVGEMPRTPLEVLAPEKTPGGTHTEPPTILELIKRGHTVVVTELDPPKTLELEKFYTGARALRDAGSDLITLADNSLAILRVSNLAIAAILQQQFQITPLVHLSCRDRNVIGLQSELLGMAALGIRHVLPLTGDPAKVGDHPGATSVYDVTSIELIRIIGQLNLGLNAGGKSIKEGTRLVVGCTFNPNAKNLDAQVQRLERKIAAGAQYVMTQPLFDTTLVEETARRTKGLGVPLLIGVWPLLNGRQAEFLHNEVPGIVIPESVRTAMRGKEGTDGRAQGMMIAKDVCRSVLDHFPGVYLITPFLVYETTVELAHFARAEK